LLVTWLDEDTFVLPSAPSDAVEIEESGACVRAALKDISGKHTLPTFAKAPRRWRQ